MLIFRHKMESFHLFILNIYSLGNFMSQPTNILVTPLQLVTFIRVLSVVLCLVLDVLEYSNSRINGSRCLIVGKKILKEL